jgi:hypothetical protein
MEGELLVISDHDKRLARRLALSSIPNLECLNVTVCVGRIFVPYRSTLVVWP